MLLIAIFSFFSAIFGFLYQTSNHAFNENMLGDLLTSFASYVRIFGWLPPAAENNQVPWDKIGISRNFFENSNEYVPEEAYRNEKDLVQIDCLHWILQNIVARTEYENRDKSKIHFMHLSPHAFSVNYYSFGHLIKLDVTNEIILKHMNFDMAFLNFLSYITNRAVYPCHNSLLKDYLC